jgi:acyl carrier protein
VNDTNTDITAEAERTIRACVAEVTGLDPQTIQPDGDFESFGIDSAGAVALIIEVEERLGLTTELPPEVLFEQRTVGDLARYIGGLLAAERAGA